MTTVYNDAKRAFLEGEIDWGADVFRIALIDDATYTPDPDAEVFVDDVIGVNATEFSDASYSRATVTTSAATADNTDDEGVADATDVTFSALTGGDVDGVLLYKQVGGDDTTPGNDPVIAYLTSTDLPITTNGEDFTVEWAAEGVLNLG